MGTKNRSSAGAATEAAGEATQRRAHNEIENKKEQQKNVKRQRENTTRNTLQQLATRHADALACISIEKNFNSEKREKID